MTMHKLSDRQDFALALRADGDSYARIRKSLRVWDKVDATIGKNLYALRAENVRDHTYYYRADTLAAEQRQQDLLAYRIHLIRVKRGLEAATFETRNPAHLLNDDDLDF